MRGRLRRCCVATSAAERSAQRMAAVLALEPAEPLQHAGDVDLHAADVGAGAALGAAPQVVALQHGVDLAGQDQPDQPARPAVELASARAARGAGAALVAGRSTRAASSSKASSHCRADTRSVSGDVATALTSRAGGAGARKGAGSGADQLHLVLERLAATARRRRRVAANRRMRRPTLRRSTAQRCQSSSGRGVPLSASTSSAIRSCSRALVSPRAVLAAALGAAGEEHAGRAQAGRLHDVQRADAPQARQLDEPHVLGVLVALLAAEADGGAGALLAVEADDRLRPCPRVMSAMRPNRASSAEVVRDGDLGAVGGADAAGPADLGVDDGELAVVLDLGRPRLRPPAGPPA